MTEPITNVELICNDLRGELKAWEKQFAALNGGRKAGRDDIKGNAAIAAKYKRYNKLRAVLAGQRDVQSPTKKTTLQHEPEFSTPAKRRTILMATPSKSQSVNTLTPSKRQISDENAIELTVESTPAHIRSMLGPTPQKNGVVVGLFDLFPAQTPSDRKDRSVLEEIHHNSDNVAQTPSRKVHDPMDEEESGKHKWSRTPMSAGKRFFLDKFATPVKRKRDDDIDVSDTVSRQEDRTTPLFLRRDAPVLDCVVEEESALRPPPFKRRSFVRSLSSLIQRAKKQEEDRLDEELDMLREMEDETNGDLSAKEKSKGLSEQPQVPRILVEDTQNIEMELGHDELRISEAEEQEYSNQEGKPRKVWKKKGQKRQTRRAVRKCYNNLFSLIQAHETCSAPRPS
jgi:hypothetical protein